MKIVYFAIALCLLCSFAADVDANEIAADSNGCNKHCPINYDPICGTDESGNSQTFSNECFMKVENCVKRLNFHKTASAPCP